MAKKYKHEVGITIFPNTDAEGTIKAIARILDYYGEFSKIEHGVYAYQIGDSSRFLARVEGDKVFLAHGSAVQVLKAIKCIVEWQLKGAL